MTAFPWPEGRSAALSLTYDDARPCHRDEVAPQLAAAGVHATFYLPAGAPDVLDHAPVWRAVAAMGHELGNHTVFHPCRDEPPGAKARWLDPAYDLARYTPRRWRDELRVANGILQLIDGRARRSFGNTCHHLVAGPAEDGVRISAEILDVCVAGRGPQSDRVIDPATCALGELGCFGGDGLDAQRLLAIAEAALAAGGWAIVCIHGVGPGSRVDAGDHARFVAELRSRRDRLWCAPVAEVATWIAERRQEPRTSASAAR